MVNGDPHPRFSRNRHGRDWLCDAGGLAAVRNGSGDMKELYIEAHEDLVDDFLEAHPQATWQQAYDATADLAYSHMTDRMADMADTLRDRMKYGER